MLGITVEERVEEQDFTDTLFLLTLPIHHCINAHSQSF
jgi:hypothetical protein